MIDQQLIQFRIRAYDYWNFSPWLHCGFKSEYIAPHYECCKITSFIGTMPLIQWYRHAVRPWSQPKMSKSLGSSVELWSTRGLPLHSRCRFSCNIPHRCLRIRANLVARPWTSEFILKAVNSMLLGPLHNTLWQTCILTFFTSLLLKRRSGQLEIRCVYWLRRVKAVEVRDMRCRGLVPQATCEHLYLLTNQTAKLSLHIGNWGYSQLVLLGRLFTYGGGRGRRNKKSSSARPYIHYLYHHSIYELEATIQENHLTESFRMKARMTNPHNLWVRAQEAADIKVPFKRVRPFFQSIGLALAVLLAVISQFVSSDTRKLLIIDRTYV